MKNFAMTVNFRPPVNKQRQKREFSQEDQRFEKFQSLLTKIKQSHAKGGHAFKNPNSGGGKEQKQQKQQQQQQQQQELDPS